MEKGFVTESQQPSTSKKVGVVKRNLRDRTQEKNANVARKIFGWAVKPIPQSSCQMRKQEMSSQFNSQKSRMLAE